MARTIADLRLRLGAALLMAMGGCGSGGKSSDGGGHGGGTAGGGGAGGGGGTTTVDAGTCAPAMGIGGVTTSGTVSWLDDGVPQCASLIETTRMTTTTVDFLGVIAVGLDSQYSVDVIVSTDGTPISGTYSCGSTPAAPDVMLGIIDPDENGSADTCTITVTNAGSAATHAQGTFSGTISGDGATRTITNGVFDVAVMPSS